MSKDALEKRGTAAVTNTDGVAPTERELLIQIVKLQMQLNSKMFEFLREYQVHHNRGEYDMFRTGSGSKTRAGRLRDEVNELGVALGQAASAFTGEQLYEKRDQEGRVLAHCRVCEKESPFAQVIDAPYGMAGAYMAGSERLICIVCKEDTLYPGDERLPKFNCVFRVE